jgi:hypothetical protein
MSRIRAGRKEGSSTTAIRPPVIRAIRTRTSMLSIHSTVVPGRAFIKAPGDRMPSG